MENLMEENTTKTMPIINIAWTHFAQLDAASLGRGKSYMRIRRWIAVLGVLTTLFAILIIGALAIAGFRIPALRFPGFTNKGTLTIKIIDKPAGGVL
jgi:hypothetical protein